MLRPKKKGYSLGPNKELDGVAPQEMGLAPTRASKKKEAPSVSTSPSKLLETQAAAYSKKHAEDTSL